MTSLYGPAPRGQGEPESASQGPADETPSATWKQPAEEARSAPIEPARRKPDPIVPPRAWLIPIVIAAVTIAILVTRPLWHETKAPEPIPSYSGVTQTVDYLDLPTGDAPPSLGSLIVDFSDGAQRTCSGVLAGANADRVVTAAQCVTSETEGVTVTGLQFLTPFDDLEEPVTSYPGDPATIFLHPEYDAGIKLGTNFDLAVIRLGPDVDGELPSPESAAILNTDVAHDIVGTTWIVPNDVPFDPAAEHNGGLVTRGCEWRAVYVDGAFVTAYDWTCPRDTYVAGAPVYVESAGEADELTVVVAIMHEQYVPDEVTAEDGLLISNNVIDQVIVDEVARP